MRKQSLLKTMLLLCALIVGSSSAWADYKEFYNLNCPKTSSNSAYATYYDVTINGMDWEAPGNQNIDGGWRIGGKSLTDPVDRVITGKSPMGSAISKITFNHMGKSRASVSVPYVKLTVASDADFNTIVDEVTVSEPSITKDTESSFDFTPTSPLTEWNSGYYYKITINVKNTDSSNGGLNVTSIVFYKTVADKTATTTTITSTGITNTDLKNGTTAGTLTASVTAGEDAVAGATVAWESSDPAVATIDEDGVITLVAVGTTTITATYAGNATYYGSSDTYELEVTDTRVATVTTIDDTGLTNTDVHTSTLGGTLTASVTAGEDAVAGATVTWVSSDPTVATVDASGNVTLVKVGTTTITASYAGDDTYAASSGTYELTVTDSSAPLLNESVSKYTSNNDSSTKITADNASTYLDDDTKWDYSGFSNAYPGKNGCFKLGTSSNKGTIVTNALSLTGNGMLTFQAKQYKSGEDALTISVDGATASGDISITAGSDFKEYTVYLTDVTDDVVITFETPSKRVYLDEIKLVNVEKQAVTVTTAEYATYCGNFDLDFTSTGITAFTATDNDETVKLNVIENGQVPAGNPVVLYKAGGGTVDVPVIASAAAITVSNDLWVSDGTAANDNMYVLAEKTNGVGFYLWNNDGGNAIPEGKIYLQATSTSTARSFLGFEEGNTTSIDVRSKMEDVRGEVYNLNGQRVAQPTKGLYIVNGKKVVVK